MKLFDSEYFQRLISQTKNNSRGRQHCNIHHSYEEPHPKIWYAEHRVQIEGEIQMIKDQRFLALMEVSTVARVRDDLSREYYRTLLELRKRQAW